MKNSMTTGLLSKLRLAGLAVALALVVMALAACGSESAQSTPDSPQPTAPPATAVPTPGADSAATMEAPEPASNTAPKFELSNAIGETVSLGSYAGSKNVVLVFYRGFW